MKYERLIAYLLIGIGALALLARLDGDSGWLWMAIAAAGFLAVYAAQRSYGFLVVGCILAGVALGLLLEGNWGWDGTFLISLGAGFFAIERVEPKKGRWPLYIAALLAVLGLLVLLVEAGILGSIWFALILIVAGIYLLMRRGEADSRGPGTGGWVSVTRPATPAEPPQTSPSSTATAHTTTPPTPPRVQTPEDVAADNESAGEDTGMGSLSAEAKLRYERLESWRKRRADIEDTNAYIVLHNDTLERIARTNPQTLGELGAIKGIGPVKLERYGQEILDILRGETS